MSQSYSKFKAGLKNPEVFKAFEALKNALVSAQVLAYSDFSFDFYVMSDASSKALGAVIRQFNKDGLLVPIMYASRHLTSAETRYSTSERELLGVVFAAKIFYAYVYGRHVTFILDHQPLKQDLNYSFVYQPSSENVTADLLSRPESEVNSITLNFESSLNWRAEQSKDFYGFDEYEDLIEWKKYFNKLKVLNDCLYLETDAVFRLVVPKQLIKLILEFFDDLPLAGHRDFEKTLESIKLGYFWLNMTKETKEYCVMDERPVHLIDSSVNVEIIESDNISKDVEEKVNRCEICDKDFNTFRGLKSHNTWKHSSRSTNNHSWWNEIPYLSQGAATL
ncbi:unnamed protein product [Brachionus calyciflorus]|uniref:C2H2-type domain-containing protein n=1 Tax=Brachionus calyciflorus TaxID=104777 RepID=A0A814LJR2_9BILA|nr:unnamed protein product [Brachionus calyciflorus]